MLKQMEPTVKMIGEHTFYLRPLPAMRAAKVSGQLIAALAPVFAGIAPLLGENSGEVSQLDVGAIAEGLGMLDENKLDSLIRALLFSYGNVAVETEGKAVSLTEDLVNELFCGEVQDLFLLCGYVVQENFQSFFRKWSSLSGAQNLLRRIQT